MNYYVASATAELPRKQGVSFYRGLPEKDAGRALERLLPELKGTKPLKLVVSRVSPQEATLVRRIHRAEAVVALSHRAIQALHSDGRVIVKRRKAKARAKKRVTKKAS